MYILSVNIICIWFFCYICIFGKPELSGVALFVVLWFYGETYKD